MCACLTSVGCGNKTGHTCPGAFDSSKAAAASLVCPDIKTCSTGCIFELVVLKVARRLLPVKPAIKLAVADSCRGLQCS